MSNHAIKKITWFNPFNPKYMEYQVDFRNLPGMMSFLTAFNKNDIGPDRTDTIKFPLNFQILNKILPLSKQKISYADACDARAIEIMKKAESNDSRIFIMWSGGIDSTTIMSAFLRNTTCEQQQRITVFMSQNTIKENPRFFKKFVLGKLTYESSINFADRFSEENAIFVHGECNGQLYGDMDEFSNTHFMNMPKSNNKLLWQHHLTEAPTLELINSMWKYKEFNPKVLEVVQHIVTNSAQSVGIELENLHQFAAWYKICFIVQYCQVRPIAFMSKKILDNTININNRVIAFFVSNDFDQWAMQRLITLREHCKIQRLESREYIKSFDGDIDYFENKQKVNSGGPLFNQLKIVHALDSEMNFVPKDQLSTYYSADNIFN
jgi:hypothetical protein